MKGQMEKQTELVNLIHPLEISADCGGELTFCSRHDVHWEWMGLTVRRLLPGEVWTACWPGEEAAYVLLSGICVADWGHGPQLIGERKSVFDGLPYTVYAAPGKPVSFIAETTVEIAACHVPSESDHPSRLITPDDVKVSLRGGGNASRQIVDILPPTFPADRLIAVEVYTPGGNWSSYPPHKHEVHNPPAEVDLDEIYYFRMNRSDAFAHQRLYSSDGRHNTVLTVRDGDTVLVRDGYHPVVAGPGYDTYYLNFLAGSARSLAASEDPSHVWIRSEWKEIDPRLPLVTQSWNSEESPV
jgi:5-deoxy-glucuronate isomerase